MNKKFITFVNQLESASGNHAICEAIKQAYRAIHESYAPPTQFGSEQSRFFGPADETDINNNAWTADFGVNPPPGGSNFEPTITAAELEAGGWLPTLAGASVQLIGENPYFAYFVAVRTTGKRYPVTTTRYYCAKKFADHGVKTSDIPMQAKFDATGKITMRDVPGYRASSRYIETQKQQSGNGKRFSGQKY